MLDMYKLRIANFFDFIAINNINKKYFKTYFGGKNTNLFYQFILLLFNDFLKLFNLNFLVIHCLEKNGKIVATWAHNVISKDTVANVGMCVVPEERGKGLAKFLAKKGSEMLRRSGVKYSYFLTSSKSLLFIKKSKPKTTNTFYHYKLNQEMLRNSHVYSFQLSKYETNDFPFVSKLIEKAMYKTDSVFIPFLFRPPKSNLYSILEKFYFLMEFGSVWKYCIKKDEKIVGYVEVNYYPQLKELKIYILFEEKIDYLLNEFNRIFEQNDIPTSKLDIHVFVKPLKKEKISFEELERRTLFEMKNLLRYSY